MSNIEADATTLKTMCLLRETRKQALAYMRVLRRSVPRKSLPDNAVYYCAFIASEQLQNTDALPSKIREKGGLGRSFWSDLGNIQNLLCQASNSIPESADQGSFTYTRLPEYEPACKSCRTKGLPCLKRRATSQLRKPIVSSKCQICYSRKVACKIGDRIPGHNDDEFKGFKLEYLDHASPTLSQGDDDESVELGTIPGSSQSSAASSPSELPIDLDQLEAAQYVVVAYEKAFELIKHVKENKLRLDVKLQEAVIDMEYALDSLEGPDGLQERLARLSHDEFQTKKELVVYACEEVAHLSLSSNAPDVKLQVLLPALKRRVAQLADA